MVPHPRRRGTRIDELISPRGAHLLIHSISACVIFYPLDVPRQYRRQQIL